MTSSYLPHHCLGTVHLSVESSRVPLRKTSLTIPTCSTGQSSKQSPLYFHRIIFISFKAVTQFVMVCSCLAMDACLPRFREVPLAVAMSDFSHHFNPRTCAARSRAQNDLIKWHHLLYPNKSSKDDERSYSTWMTKFSWQVYFTMLNTGGEPGQMRDCASLFSHTGWLHKFHVQ